MAQRDKDIRLVPVGIEAETATPIPTAGTHEAGGAAVDEPADADPTTEVEHDRAAWGYSPTYEPRWPATMAALVALLLYYTVPEELTPGPNWLVPALELAVIIPLNVAAPRITPSRVRRRIAIFLIGAISAANLVALFLLVQALLEGQIRPDQGRLLIVASIHIWLTNVIIFGLWYWELDRGGPGERVKRGHRHPDFLFPQMATPEADPGWTPGLVDYLFLSFANSTAFSPADTVPLTPWAKALMLVQALASLLTIALVAARAVNILS